MSEKLDSIASGIFGAVSGYIARQLAPLRVRLTTISTRQDMLEARAVELGDTRSRSMVYRGIFVDGAAYQRGDTCTRDGSLWFCEAPTTTKPGTDATWRLTSKHGKSGERGPPGPKGDMPDHRWDGTALAFEKPDGGFGESVELRGPQGKPGTAGGLTALGLPLRGGGGAPTTVNGWFPQGW